MTKLRILFTKAKKDGSQDILTCIRPDGSRTWAKLNAVFPIHDMTHYSVEMEMRSKNGFFGLLAQGWNLTDFDSPENRARMPLEALWVEHVVGIVWREYVTRNVTPYPEFSEAVAATVEALRESLQRNARRQGPRADYSEFDVAALVRPITEVERTNIMSRIGELAAQWAQTPRGEIMELPFEVS